MPARPSTGVRSQPTQQFAAAPVSTSTVLTVRPPDRSVRELREKVAVREAQYRLSGRSLFMPWLDERNICHAPAWKLEAAFVAMRNHYIVKPAILQKLFAVSSLDLQSHPADERNQADKDIADFARYQFGQILGVRDIILETLFPSAVLGNVVCELVWDAELWTRGRWRGRRLYRALKAKARAKPVYDEFRNIIAIQGPGADGKTEEWEPEGFVVLKNLPWFGDDGTSDFLAVYQLVWEMETVKALRNIHLDKFTSPFVHLTYNAEAQQIAQATKDEATGEPLEIQNVLEENVKGVKSRSYLITPDGVTAAALQLAVRGEQEFRDAIKDYEQNIVLCLDGAFLQTITSPGSPGDVRGNSQTQASTAQLFVWDAAASICTELNRQAVPLLIRENFGDGADYPTLALAGINLDEMKKQAEIYGLAVRDNVGPSRAAYAKATGVQLAADDGDRLLPPTVSPLPPGTPGTTSTFRFAETEDEKKKLTQRPARKLEVPTRYSSASPPKLDGPAKS